MARQAFKKDKDVAAFYRNQATRYDGFREALLPDRDTFLRYCVPWSRVPALLKKTKPTYARPAPKSFRSVSAAYPRPSFRRIPVPSPRNIRVAAAPPPRPASAEDLHGISTSRPRRRRDLHRRKTSAE